MATENCIILGQQSQGVEYSTTKSSYVGFNYSVWYPYSLKFTTPNFLCASSSLTFTISLIYGSRNDERTDKLDVRYALCTSDANFNLYKKTNAAVSDTYQITSGTKSFSGLNAAGAPCELTISTNELEPNTTYYLILWGSDVGGYNQDYGTARPSTYHTCVLNYNDHSYADATCTEPKKCIHCGETIGNPLGHNSVNGGTVNVHTKCSRCGITLSSTHSYTSSVHIAATCTEKGTTKYSCNCGYSYTSQDIQAKGHSYVSTVTDPTCTEQGYTTHTCSVCGDSYKDTYTNATGHSYTATVVAPTCTEQGYTKYKCSKCGDTSKANDSYTAALGHNYVGKVTTEPTYTSEGVMTYTCSRCGAFYTEPIPKKEGGLVYIDNGTSFEAYQVYIDNGSSWDLYIPYIDNGSGWDPCA